MTVDLASPAIRWLPLVEFTWGTSNVRRYVRSEEDVTVGGNLYTAEPRIEWKFKQAQHGGTRDAPLELMMHKDTEPLVWMQVEKFGIVEVTVSEVRADDLTMTRCVFVGIIHKTILRARGKADLMKAEIASRKQRMKDVSLGIIATNRCVWTFRDITCLFNPTAFVETAIVDLIDDTFIELDVLPNNSQVGGGNGLYTRGIVSRDGLNILVRKHLVSNDPPRLQLAHAAPALWLNAQVTVSAGCDKTALDCAFYDRQEAFGAFGLIMPKYNPVIEDGSSCV